jgi:type II secretory ATPase GspE/PulE/Tfp pilus assembly ATPase PilB-like protein
MQGTSGADPKNVMEKKRPQNRMAQQKYRKSFIIRISSLPSAYTNRVTYLQVND